MLPQPLSHLSRCLKFKYIIMPSSKQPGNAIVMAGGEKERMNPRYQLTGYTMGFLGKDCLNQDPEVSRSLKSVCVCVCPYRWKTFQRKRQAQRIEYLKETILPAIMINHCMTVFVFFLRKKKCGSAYIIGRVVNV